MKFVAGIAVSGLLISQSVFAAPKCDVWFGKDPATIHDVLKVNVSSGLTNNFKLTFNNLFQSLENLYGGLVVKVTPTSMNLDWKKMKTDTIKEAGKLETTNDQYYKLADFMAGFNDGHVSVELPSTLRARLPLQIHSVDDRLYAGFISKTFPKGIRKPEAGDELLMVNGLSPDEYQSQYSYFNAAGNFDTNKTLFGFMVGGLSEESGFPLTKEKPSEVKLTFKSFKTGEDYEIVLPYKYEGIGLIGKDLDGKDPNPPVITAVPPSKKKDPGESYAPRTTSVVQKMLSLFRTEAVRMKKEFGPQPQEAGVGQKLEIGGLKPFFKLPRNFKRIEVPKEILADEKFKNFLSPDSFYAGTFKRNGKRVGFLRIPSYEASSVASIATTIRYFIGRLEAESDYLVIDQTNNPGGMVIMSDMLLQALNGKYDTERHMHFAVKPSQGFIREYVELREDIRKNEDGLLSEQQVRDFVARLDVEYEKIYSAYKEGKALSDPISMLVMAEYTEQSYDKALFKLPWGPVFEKMVGVDIQKHQTYTKPIYFMINELDFSGGDATPAGFQDYGRGYLVGTHPRGHTAGSGGTVEAFSIRSLVELTVHWTTSLMVRFKGKLVENYAVTADFNVPLTQADVADGYSNYFNRFLTDIEAHMAQNAAKPQSLK